MYIKIEDAMKKIMMLSLMMLSSCTFLDGANIGGTASNGGGSFSAIPQFDTVSTGWLKAGSAIQVKVSGSSSYQCKLAKPADLAATAYTNCTVNNGMVSLNAPSSGITNGSFVFNVKGSDGTVVSIPFYVHDSLNNVAECTLSKTDAEYFSIAGARLDQSMAFGPATDLKIPVGTVEFPPIAAPTNFMFADGTLTDQFAVYTSLPSQAVEYRSLRKRMVANSANTLILMKRKYVNRFDSSHCGIVAHTDGAYRNNPLGGVATDISTGTQPRLFLNPDVSMYRYKIIHQDDCEALVINAVRTGVCFLKDGRQYYVKKVMSEMKDKRFNSSAYYGIGYPHNKMFSAKFKKSEEALYQTIQSVGPSTSGFILLED
jgi:hypothetical protein